MTSFNSKLSGVSIPPIGSPGGKVLNDEIQRGMIRISRLAVKKRIGTWNVRSLYEQGKIHNAILEMKRLDIAVLGISEMRWPNSGTCIVDNHTVYYSGEDSNHHRNGVGFIVRKDASQAVTSFLPQSDRIAMIKMQASPVNFNLIQVYAPTTAATDQQIEEFYADLKATLLLTKSNEITIIMGDFNAKVGRGQEGNTVGNQGLGIRNERGDRLVQFCQEEGLALMNTFFQLPARRLYTWKSPADTSDNIVRNQIDFFGINQRFRNTVKSCKTYPGADVPSDHNLLIAELEFRPKKMAKKTQFIRINTRKLKDTVVKADATDCLRTKLDTYANTETDVEDLWNHIKKATIDVANEKIRQDNRRAKQKWMTEEILTKMDERRQYKNKDADKYRQLQREIRRDIRAAKESKHKNDCNEIEELQARHDIHGVHKKIRMITGNRRKLNTNTLLDKHGQVIQSLEDKRETWKDYIQELFHDIRPHEHQMSTAISGPPITTSEVEKALGRMKDGKAVGPDEVQVEVLKLLQEKGLCMLVQLFNAIYESGNIPSDWLKSTFITLPKKTNARKCGEYRTISIMSHALKLFLKVIHERIYHKLEERVGHTQFGFTSGLGTRDALFAAQVLIQRCRDVNKNVYACFIDFEKAFDKVKHQKMLEILNNTGIDDKDIRIIGNLYWKQRATVRVEDSVTDEIEILRGVRQGCILSPLLFNVYSEELFKDTLHEMEEGIIVNGEVINNIRYADDTLLIADTLEGLQSLLSRISEAGEEYGLKLNAGKTKYMVISKEANPQDTGLYANNTAIERVQRITYLGCNMNETWDHSAEIKTRIALARVAFMRMRSVLCSHNLSLQIRIRIVKCYVFSVLLYGMEAWTLTEATAKKIDAFEMWVYRRILRISWVDRITNEEVLRRMGKKLEIMPNIKIRKLSYLGHIMRNTKYRLLQLIMQGKINGNRGPGRRRTSWLRNLRQWYGKTSVELFRAAINKVIIAVMIANIR